MEKITLQIEGMDCSNCALGIQKFLEKKGTKDANVSFTNAEACFVLEDESALPKIVSGIENLGYEVIQENEERSPKKKLLSPTLKVVIVLVFTLPLLLSMFVDWHYLHDPYVQLALCTPVFVIGVLHFGRGAFYSLKSGVANMDVLVIGGAIAAFAYSLYGTINKLGHDFLFYETTASIILFILVGHLIESRAIAKTTTAVDELVSLQDTKAKKIVLIDGVETLVDIPAKDIKVGDILQVNTGDTIPTDGSITWGEAAINEAMLTGESLPVEKGKSASLIGGTILERGTIKMMATKVGKQTMLAQIISLVKDAQNQKPNIQKLSDKISAIFVPIVLVLSLLTFLLSFFVFSVDFKASLIHSIAVLVISCPCAMGLAVPTAVVVGIGKAAKNGVLIKGADTLERLEKVNTVVFDKTGTLTTGDFQIQKIDTFGHELDKVKSVIYSLERYSSHPIAISLCKIMKGASSMMLLDIKENKGLGMEAKDRDGNFYQLGSFRLCKEASQIDADAHLYLYLNGDLIARVYLKDEIKPFAKELLAYLHQKNIKTFVLSGDTNHKTKALSDTLGIKAYFAEKTPEEKLQILDELSTTQNVAMVGDGINDAPALAKAFVGISLSNANQIAIKAAQIILLNGDLEKLVEAFEVGKNTIKVIKQNLFWAFFYNIIAIPMAAVGLLTPMLASIAMASSDVVVVMNSLRLRWMGSIVKRPSPK